MAIWKRKKKKKESEESLQKEEIEETTEEGKETSESNVSFPAAIEEEPVQGSSKQEEPVSEKQSEIEVSPVVQEPKEITEDISGGVILYGRKISGFVGKGFWGLLSIFILPPVFAFAFSVAIMVFMLIFPLLAVTLIASTPVVFVTLFIFLIALPVVFPLIVLFLLITGKGRLLIGSEGKWFGIEMFGKSYTLKK